MRRSFIVLLIALLLGSSKLNAQPTDAILFSCPTDSGIHFMYDIRDASLAIILDLVAVRCEGDRNTHSLIDREWNPLVTTFNRDELETRLAILRFRLVIPTLE